MRQEKFAKIAVLIFSAALSTAVSGCVSIVDSVDGHLTEMNVSADNFRNQAILLNIVRAQHGAPLSFVAMPTILGQYNSNFNAGLPTYSIGPLAVQSGRPFGFSNDTFGTSLNNQTSPTFNNIIGKEFTQAATTAVSALQLLRFARDGFPVDLLLSLTASKISLYTDGKFESLDTFPVGEKGCPFSAPGEPYRLPVVVCVEKIRHAAHDLGIDFEATRSTNPNKATVAGFKLLSEESKIEASIDIDARICFNHADAISIKKYSYLRLAGIGDSQCYKNQGIYDYEIRRRPAKMLGPIQVEFRSLVGIYRFLGEVMHRPEISQSYIPIGSNDGEPFIDIRIDEPGRCFVEVAYQGRRYCVPENGARRTKQVFALLDQIQNNNTDVSKLPQPSVVNLSGRAQ